MVRQSNWGRFTSLSVNESACKSFWVAWTRKGRKQRVAASFSASRKSGLSVAAHPPVCAASPSYSCECCQGWEEGRSGVSGWLVAVLMVCSDWLVRWGHRISRRRNPRRYRLPSTIYVCTFKQVWQGNSLPDRECSGCTGDLEEEGSKAQVLIL